MPKQVHNIQQFHGGLSTGGDPRDIAENELSSATDVMVDELGKIRTLGGIAAHDAGTNAVDIEPGYGLFQFSHDRHYAHIGEHLAEGSDFTTKRPGRTMSDLLSSAQKVALADSLDSDNDIFDFATGSTTLVAGNGFTATNATFANSSAVGQLTNTASAQGIVTLPITTVSNQTYQVEFDVTAISTAQINVSLGTSAAYNSSNKVTSSGAATGLTLDVPYKANDASTFLALQLTTSTSGHWVKIDNLKITLLPWDVTGDFSVDSTDATYTDDANAGTLIQTVANRAEVGLNSKEYIFTYTISGFAETITLFEILGGAGQFANTTTALEQSNGTHIVIFTSRSDAASNPFTINVTSGSSGAFNIDNVSLVLYDTPETGDDYLALADDESGDPAVYIYSKNEDVWSNDQIIDIGDDNSFAPAFYYVDGALRISDGNFGSSNVNRWYGYISRTLFSNVNEGERISQWNLSVQELVKPSTCFFDKSAPTIVDGESMTRFPGDEVEEGTDISVTYAGTTGQPLTDGDDDPWDNVYRVYVLIKVRNVGFTGGGDYSYELTVDDGAGTHSRTIRYPSTGEKALSTGDDEEQEYTFYFDAANDDINISGGETLRIRVRETTMSGSGTIYFELDKVTAWEGVYTGVTHTELLTENVWLSFNNATSPAVGSGWDDNWHVGVSFEIDGVQESKIVLAEKSTGATNVILSGLHEAKGVDCSVYFRWTRLWDKRITGINWYLRKLDAAGNILSNWYKQGNISFITSQLKASSGVFEVLRYDSSTGEFFGFLADSLYTSPFEIINYQASSGISEDDTSIHSKYKTAVVVNRTVYIGNVEIQYDDGTKEVKGDAMIKAPVNRFDVFPLSGIIEASVRDGDSIVKLEEYADRILQFKKNKMHLINISQDEFLEDTFMHKGVSNPAATCKTDFGIAWVNKLGCYLYDGKQVVNLLEKGGRQIIKESDWESFINDNSMIAYIPKKRQLIVTRDNRDTFTITGTIDSAASTTVPGVNTLFLEEIAVGDSITVKVETREVTAIASNTSLTVDTAFSNNPIDISVECLPSGNIFLYDMVTQSWVKGDSALTDDVSKTNFVTDWNGDLVHAHTAGTLVKWDDTSDTTGTMSLRTKDIDFGQPSQRKKVYRVRVSYKGDGQALITKFSVNGDTDAAHQFNSDNTPLSNQSDLTKWHHVDLKPTTSSNANNIYSFMLHMNGTTGDDFEINDISLVYRLKGTK